MPAVDPARETALRLLCELEEHRAPINRLFAGLENSALDVRDRNFVRQLVLGTQRWLCRLDWIVDQFARRPIASCTPQARQILRLGVYQLLWLDRVPHRAAVHTSVELAKRSGHPGTARFVNAVLRQILRRKDRIPYPSRQEDLAAHLAVYHSHPQWLVERWLQCWGTRATEALLHANNTPAPLYIRTNPLRTSPPELDAALGAEGHKLQPCGPLEGYFAVEEAAGLFRSAAYCAGSFQVQDINAGLPAALLAPRPGERVLDLCSAPGGKATQLAEMMRDQGLVVAADSSPTRLRLVRDNAQRLALQCIHLLAHDAATSGPGDFDRILADVPCSNTGIFGRHPDARWRKCAAQLPDLVAVQRSILHRAFARLKAGGVLVYSTCSLETEENSATVESFLAEVPEAHLEEAHAFFPNHPWAQHYVQTLPGRDPGDACFAARIRKREQ